MSEKKKTDAEIEKAEEDLQEILSRLARLRAQRRVLHEKSSSLISRGLRQLREEDGVESQEEALLLAEQQAVGDAQAAGALGVIDWTAIGLEGFGGSSIDGGGVGSS